MHVRDDLMMMMMLLMMMMLESYRSVEKRREREEERGKERPDGAIMYAEAACGKSCMAWRMCMDIHVFCMGRECGGGPCACLDYPMRAGR